MKLNERNEVINVIDFALGKEISTEHMIDLITWVENDDRFEYGTLTHLNEKQAKDYVINNLDMFMKKHSYRFMEEKEVI